MKAFYDDFVKEHSVKANIDAVLPEGVTVTKRVGENGEFLFVQNFDNAVKKVALKSGTFTDVLTGKEVASNITLLGFEVKALKRR